MHDHEHIRTWALDAFRLEVFDTHRTGHDNKARLAYELFHGGRLIFRGDDFFASPLHAIDGDETVASLLSFLSLRPGDTDPDYFDQYTPEQLTWCQAHGEELSLHVEQLQERAKTRREYEQRVRGPGKFEGEPAYVAYFWDRYLEGCHADDDGEVVTFTVTDEDRAIFPDLEGANEVSLYETDSGFVCQL